MTVIWFTEPASAAIAGGKGYCLCRLTQAGLPVPEGFCIPQNSIDTIRVEEIECALARMAAGAVAVRSSAPDEDGAQTSFAGIHATRLNVHGGLQVWNALQEIRQSATSAAALSYRRQLGIVSLPGMAAVVQTMLAPEAAGVLFMRDPVDRSDRIVIEGSWGLGESVVTGTDIPDRWILSRDGKVISVEIADKETAIVAGSHGTIPIEVPENQRNIPCLSPGNITELVELGLRCDRLFEAPQDVEWALANGKLWLLQSRAITWRRIGP